MRHCLEKWTKANGRNFVLEILLRHPFPQYPVIPWIWMHPLEICWLLMSLSVHLLLNPYHSNRLIDVLRSGKKNAKATGRQILLLVCSWTTSGWAHTGSDRSTQVNFYMEISEDHSRDWGKFCTQRNNHTLTSVLDNTFCLWTLGWFCKIFPILAGILIYCVWKEFCLILQEALHKRKNISGFIPPVL